MRARLLVVTPLPSSLMFTISAPLGRSFGNDPQRNRRRN